MSSKKPIKQSIKGDGNIQVAGDLHFDIDITQEIDDIAKILKERKSIEAINLLERLWRKHNDKMTPRQQYRVQANLGHAYDQKGEYQEAAKYWLKAIQYEPNFEEAQARQAWAYYYQGNMLRARGISEQILKHYPEVTLARAIWIRTASKDHEYHDIEGQIPKHQLDDPDIMLALADVASDKCKWEQAEKYYAKAIKTTDGFPDIKEHFASKLLGKIELWKYAMILKTASNEDEVQINKAIQYLKEASVEWREKNDTARLARTKNKLASAYRALGNNEEYERNIKIAYELDSSNEQIICEYSAILANNGEIDKSIQLVEAIVNNSINLVVNDLYVQLLINRNKTNDKKIALAILKKREKELRSYLPSFRFDYIKQIILLIGEIEDMNASMSYLEELEKDIISEPSLMILKAYVFMNNGNRDKSIELAISLCQSPMDEWHEKRNLAILLSSLGQWEHALKIWLDITNFDCLSQDLFSLLEAARQIDNIKVILNCCEELRKNEIYDFKVINLELDHREKFNDNIVAANIMKEYLSHCDNDEDAAIMRLRLSCLGMRTHRHELLESERRKLPKVQDVTPRNGRLVSQVLSNGANPLEAVDYAYELWRRHPDNEDVNLAFIGSLLPIGPDVELPKYDSIQPGTAVLYENEQTKEQTWHIIENSNIKEPINSHDEYSIEHDISQKLLGKTKGERFNLIEDDIETRSVIIKEILSKYHYRFQQCMSSFTKKFPCSKALRSFPGLNPDGTLNVETIKNITQKGNKGAEQLMEYYETRMLPICMIAHSKSVSEYLVMSGYTLDPKLRIKTCFGGTEEWEHASMCTANSEKIIIDMTALITLLLIQDDFWTTLGKKLIISEGTLSRLKNFEVAQESWVNEGGWLSNQNGKLIFTKKDVEQAEVEKVRINEFIKTIEGTCQITSGITLIDHVSNSSKEWIDAIGQYNAETLALASREGGLLWTDDLALGCLANTEFQCARTWTQVLINLYANDRISELNLKLFEYGYYFTKISVNDLILATKLSNWQAHRSPLNKVLEVFSDKNIIPESMTGLLSNFLVYIWQNSTQFTAQQITLVILSELSKHEIGYYIIKNIPVERIFGFDIINANRVRNLIEYWLIGGIMH